MKNVIIPIIYFDYSGFKRRKRGGRWEVNLYLYDYVCVNCFILMGFWVSVLRFWPTLEEINLSWCPNFVINRPPVCLNFFIKRQPLDVSLCYLHEKHELSRCYVSSLQQFFITQFLQVWKYRKCACVKVGRMRTWNWGKIAALSFTGLQWTLNISQLNVNVTNKGR